MIQVVATLKPKIQIVATLKSKIIISATLRNATINVLSDPQEVEYIAQNIIPQYTVVTIDGLRANSNTLSHRPKVLGISLTSTAIGFTGTAVSEGEITNNNWAWVVGQLIYLNGTALSATPPNSGFSQIIGRALETNRILVELEESYLL